MSGRRWSEGLHQAVEAKESVEVQPENQTMASITFQNYFRMYEKLAGMTGTADTEAYEFQEIYGLETIIIPTNRTPIRKDYQDQIFKTALEKYTAVVKDIKSCYEKGQPVLVGTTSIENSEYVSDLLNKQNLPHQVLNAKQHEKEANIIAQAGKKSMITIATNMAGRGTDIVLGGNIEKIIDSIEEDLEIEDSQKHSQINDLRQKWLEDNKEIKYLGGLHIIATERHESRRIDNQLRGRAGRQGDPGSSRFYLSLDDDLMRIFGGERLQTLFTKLKMPDNEPIEAKMISRSIESAQRKVEGRNFDVRKQLLQYDDVANEQRKEIYNFRNRILNQNSLGEMTYDIIKQVMQDVIHQYVPEQSLEEQWDIDGLEKKLSQEWLINLDLKTYINNAKTISSENIIEKVTKELENNYKNKIELAGKEAFDNFEKNIILSSIDQYWREHLANLEHLRQGIHLRGYAQKDPKQEYKREAFELFNQLLIDIKIKVAQTVSQVQVQSNQQDTNAKLEEFEAEPINLSNLLGLELKTQDTDVNIPIVSRNEPCPCGSGERYKNCHGKIV